MPRHRRDHRPREQTDEADLKTPQKSKISMLSPDKQSSMIEATNLVESIQGQTLMLMLLEALVLPPYTREREGTITNSYRDRDTRAAFCQSHRSRSR